MAEKIIGTVLKVALFVALFAMSAYTVNYIFNQNANKVSEEQDLTSLPDVSVYRDGNIINKMEGYRTKLDTRLERNGIVPISSDKKLEIIVDGDFSGKVKYELRDGSGENLIEDGEMEYVGTASLDNSNGFAKVSGINTGEAEGNDKVYAISIRMDLVESAEYTFVIILKQDDEQIRYYTRVVSFEKDNYRKLLDYAAEYSQNIFPSTTLNAGTGDKGKEKDESVPEDDLWVDINPMLATSIVPRIKEFTEDTALIELKYIVKSPDNDVIVEYGVCDNIYISYDEEEDKVNLVSSTRNVDELFASGNFSSESNPDRKHYTDRSRYIWSENGYKCAFILAGELWFYDSKEVKAARLYGCGSKNKEKDYSLFNPSDVRIISVSNDGVVLYAVVGRMDYGRFEGENGIFLYEYRADKMETKLLFRIESDESYEALKLGPSRFIWYDEKKSELYTIIDDCFRVYNIRDGKYTDISVKMPQDMIYVSEEGDRIAYPGTADEDGTDEIFFMNMKTMKTFSYKEPNKKLKIIGFKDDVLVYGAAEPDNIKNGGDGHPVFTYSNIFVIDDEGRVSKNYKKQNIFIKDVELTSNDIKLQRVVKTDGKFEDTEDDHLTYKVHQKSGDGKMPDVLYERTRMNEIVVKENTEFSIITTCNPENSNGRFYVFWDGGIKGSFASIGKALVYAQSNGGVVISGDNGSVVCGISKSDPFNTVAEDVEYIPCQSDGESLAVCALMSMKYAGADISGVDLNTISEKGFVDGINENNEIINGLNISGADLDTAISFLSNGKPFAVKIEEGRFVLVVSYNDEAIRYYDPVQDKEVKLSRSSFEKEVDAAGREIYVYMFR
ncbi:hypothetical protein [Eubacterium sp.]|uniref:hypothetical protein n=1 Tax=Eubacterium sp. TaxID=142586 RepID=UPI0025854553|nr:hypothetical protein [Eubacterium sp.]MCR5368726.1 hypothetical protein [Eubacterium sp.]